MSLARLALRLATVQALKGRTRAGAHVRDSEQGPIEELAAEAKQPTINVFTDDGSRTSTVQPRDLFGGDGMQTLVIEIVVTQRMAVKTDAGDETQWVMPPTDAGMEMAIDLIERDIAVCLSDPGNAWAEMWRRLVMEIGERQSIRGAAGKDGMRFSGRQLNWPVRLPRDPEPGQPPSKLWADFLSLVAGTPELHLHAAVIEAAVKGLAPPNVYDQVRATWSLSGPEAAAMQLGPPSVQESLP